jgi:hypothetical protein
MAHADLTGLGLEIGPSYNPLLPKSEGYRVRTADHLDATGCGRPTTWTRRA